MSNRLANASSPYLLQHRDNPVDWYPWGEEALSRARAEDRPIFLSIGYAACHWCHVMAHESFEDPATAALMNEHFINIKVDREERPDVDQIYMTAIQLTGQGGGWPLSAFCLPDGRPFFLGTYFPPGDRYGRRGFSFVLERMAELYRDERDKLVESAAALLEGIRTIDERALHSGKGGTPADLKASQLVAAGRWLVQRSDPLRGGFGEAPKFPSSSAHDLLARAGRLEHGGPAREAFLRQARGMVRGGLYDHLGGGFARYSVDERWAIPHFEKMLYDNGQLLQIYGDAYALTGDAFYERAIRETVVWLEREMSDPAGGLYASQDADSEGEEGKYYVWTPAQIAQALGAIDAEEFCRAYGVSEGGNFEGGTTHLYRATEPPAGGDGDAGETRLNAMRARLFAVRDARVHPETDTKVLAAWNGLAISGLVRAWEATGCEPALALARRVADFVIRELIDADSGRLYRVYKDGVRSLDGTLDDYAMVGHALLELAEAVGERPLWDLGAGLIAAVRERFCERQDGAIAFYLTARDADEALIHRPQSHHDGAMPSGASVAVQALLRLGFSAGDIDALELAEAALAQRCAEVVPLANARLLAGLDLYLHAQTVVVSEGDGREALLEAMRRAYAPTRILAGPWSARSILEGKTPAADGAARAYVCRGATCSAPVSDPAALVDLVS